MNGLLI